MNTKISENTKAILLLTAPLLDGKKTERSNEPKPLTPSEYKRLVRHLREIQGQPADLLSLNAAEILRTCQPVIDENRLQKLLGRGFLLSQVIERWQARAIWVVSRADADYPRRLKVRLREDAPAVLYGCGDMALLETGGLAVVGSRYVDDVLIDYTMAVGRLTAQADRTLVSGGAKGIDQAAMRGALVAGGKVCGILADSLEKTAMNREYRESLLNGRMLLISPYDPSAGFNVGNAMQRNKLIYALADTALVVSSDLNKGGTWTGAVEQLDKLKFVPVFIRSTGDSSAGLDGLRKKGALPWPNPQNVDSFEDVFNVVMPTPTTSSQVGLALFSKQEPILADTKSLIPVQHDAVPAPQAESEPSAPVDVVSDEQPPAPAVEEPPPVIPDVAPPIDAAKGSLQPELAPAEMLFFAVRSAIQQLLSAPMSDRQIAAALNVSNTQIKIWLNRLVEDGYLERKTTSVYRVKQRGLFE